MKVSDLITSHQFRESIGGSVDYVNRMSDIAAKAGISQCDLTENQKIDGVRFVPSWSWPAFLFNIFWLIYQNVRYSWAIFAGYFALMIVADFAKILGGVDGPLPIVVAVLIGIYGSSYLLWSRIHEAGLSKLTARPSKKRAFLAFGCVFGLFVIDSALQKGLPHVSQVGSTPSIANVQCSDLSADVEQMTLKNGLGGEWRIFSTANWREISRTNAMLVCNTNAVTEAGEGQYRVEVTVKNGQLFIQVLPF